MLTKRIIPCLDVNHGRVVKGRQFKNLRDVDDPVALGKAYSDAGADELVFYDITATHENRPVFTETVKAIAREISIPFTVGGGMRTTEDFREMLLAGADKVSVNSAAVLRPELISEAAERFGRQCVVLSIDGKETIKAAGTSTSKAEERTQASTSSNGQKRRSPGRRRNLHELHGRRRREKRL